MLLVIRPALPPVLTASMAIERKWLPIIATAKAFLCAAPLPLAHGPALLEVQEAC